MGFHLSDAADRVSDALHREMRVRFAPLPPPPAETVFDDGHFLLARDRFQFVTEAGVRFHYALGEGLTVDMPGPEADDEYQLYLWGTVFGAVAWLNGYFPLHASAVAIGGTAVAFTGDSGAGKSTLAAALAATGLAHVTDDTLPLAAVDGAILAVPDRKRLKLWHQSLDLLEIESVDEIHSIPGKFYSSPALATSSALPLGHLISLEDGDAVSLEPIRGTAGLVLLEEAMYRPFVPTHLGDGAGHARWLLALRHQVQLWRLRRPRSAGQRQSFQAQLAELRELIAARCV